MKKLIIGNWKAHPLTEESAILLARDIDIGVARIKKVEVVIAPPFSFLSQVAGVLSHAVLGAQDAFWEKDGPYTGEIGTEQLSKLGVRYAIAGHSERRMFLGETDDMVNKKVRALLGVNITPVICIGEREREEGAIPREVGTQIERALEGIKKNMIERVVFAYEPVWAISTNPNARPDTPDNAFRARLFIEKMLSTHVTLPVLKKMRIIYGGSVHTENVSSFISDGHMDGVLVGSASLDAKKFIAIASAANEH